MKLRERSSHILGLDLDIHEHQQRKGEVIKLVLQYREEKILQYDANTPAEYLDRLDDDWRREKLESLRSLIKTKAPELVEGIKYKMLSFGDSKGDVFQLNAQKNYVSLYVGNADKIDSDGRLLAGLDVGKGCIRFKKSIDIAATRIDEFLERAVDFWNRDIDISC